MLHYLYGNLFINIYAILTRFSTFIFFGYVQTYAFIDTNTYIILYYWLQGPILVLRFVRSPRHGFAFIVLLKN